MGDGAEARQIAYRTMSAPTPGAPGVLWLSGFMSDMGSTKAVAVAAWAAQHGYGSTVFDYSGHGVSGGRFIDGTIGRWLAEAEAVFARVTRGPQVIVGSSMGGHIALLLLRKLAAEQSAHAPRVKGCVLIAPAWDMTEELMWKKFPDDVRRAILEEGTYRQPSAYAEPYTISRALIEDGRNHLLAREPFATGCPVIILQGLLDPDVPPAHTRDLLTFLRGDVRLVEIPDGEHRLSRPGDLEKLYGALAALI